MAELFGEYRPRLRFLRWYTGEGLAMNAWTIVVVVLVVCLVLAALIMAGGPTPVGTVGGAEAKRARKKPAASSAGRPTARRPRGEEVDEAASVVPTELLRRGLPDQGVYAFDLAPGGEVKRTQYEVGLYLGAGNKDSPSRTTLMSPENLRLAAKQTSGRMYAWVVFDSPEACIAVRAGPVAGRVADLDVASLVEWIRARLVGAPPHKLGFEEYRAHLTSLGLQVEHGPIRQKEVRFNLVSVTAEAERARVRAELTALDGPAFEALDWSAYDEAVGRGACDSPVELSGDVVIDLAARTVAAPKVRANRWYMSWTHPRSYVTFHTHPAARYRGNAPEPPSSQDLRSFIVDAAHNGLVWSFVTSPEGTYILRPSGQLVSAYYQDPEGATKNSLEAYESNLRCSGGVLTCASAAIRALAEAGFIAHFRAAPCGPLLSRPDAHPDYNALDRDTYQADLAVLRATPGPDLLGADWSRVLAANEPREGGGSSWARARLVDGAIVPEDGHRFGDPNDGRSYPLGAPGPLFVATFEEENFPRRVPTAASDAARVKAESWPWMAFLSHSRVLVFRADSSGIEVHGPRVFAKELKTASGSR